MARQVVDAAYVVDHMDSMPIVDVRPAEMYAEGHIPHAKNVDYIAMDESGTLQEKFVDKFQEMGLSKDDEFIVYCQAGMHAGLSCDLLEHAGYSSLKYYQGSWLDWIQDREHPVEK